jgi:hypothetical protein
LDTIFGFEASDQPKGSDPISGCDWAAEQLGDRKAVVKFLCWFSLQQQDNYSYPQPFHNARSLSVETEWIYN